MFEHKPVDYKAGAEETRSLEVPPDLTTPEANQRFTIPGTDGEQVASYSEYNKVKKEQPCVASVSAPVVAVPAPVVVAPAPVVVAPAPVVVAPAPVAASVVPAVAVASAKLLDSNGSKRILLGEPFDRSWRRVGLALDSARIVISDKDRSSGLYYVVPARAKDDQDSSKKLPDYQVYVVEQTDGTAVSVHDASGKYDDEAARLTDLIFKNLDKGDRRSARRTAPGDAVLPAR